MSKLLWISGMLLGLTVIGCARPGSPQSWKIESSAHGEAWQVLADATYQRKNIENPAEPTVLTDKKTNFDWSGQTLQAVAETTGKRVRALNEEAVARLQTPIHSRFGPMEEETRFALVQTLADMYGVELTPGKTWEWKLRTLDAWGRPEYITSWPGNEPWKK